MSYSVTIREIDQLTPDVKQFMVDKPANYSFKPGQATEVSIDKPDWRDKKRPFSFTSLNPEPNLEFIVKIHHEGDEELTTEMDKLRVSDGLIIGDPWDAITFKGPGVFLTHGAGMASFVAILRRLATDGELAGNRVIYSARTESDLILKDELEVSLGSILMNVLTEQSDSDKYMTAHIDRDFLEDHIDDFDQPFYLSGPSKFVETVQDFLEIRGADVQSLKYYA